MDGTENPQKHPVGTKSLNSAFRCYLSMFSQPLLFTILDPPDFGKFCHVCSWLTYCRWLFVAVVCWIHMARCVYFVELAVVRF